jgi:hypothetical protein
MALFVLFLVMSSTTSGSSALDFTKIRSTGPPGYYQTSILKQHGSWNQQGARSTLGKIQHVMLQVAFNLDESLASLAKVIIMELTIPGFIIMIMILFTFSRAFFMNNRFGENTFLALMERRGRQSTKMVASRGGFAPVIVVLGGRIHRMGPKKKTKPKKYHVRRPKLHVFRL